MQARTELGVAVAIARRVCLTLVGAALFGWSISASAPGAPVAAAALGGNAGRAVSVFSQHRSAEAASAPYLDSDPFGTTPGARGTMKLELHVPAMRVAKVTLLVPYSFQIPIDLPVGKKAGIASAGVGGCQRDLTSCPEDWTEKSILVADPARYSGNAGAEACAPGAHDAVWTFELSSLLGSNAIKVPMFIDHLEYPNDQNSEYEIQFCPPQPETAKLRIDWLGFDLNSVSNPAVHGAYSWRALLVPASPTGAPDGAATYEVRSVEAIPSGLTLAGRYDRVRHQALLRARFVAPEMDASGTSVSLYTLVTGDIFPLRFLTWARTDDSGVVPFRRRTTATRKYGVRIESIGACSPTPLPLAPCKNQTAAHLESVFVRVRAK